MIGAELVTDRQDKTPAADEAKAVRALALEAGVLIGVGGTFGNVVRIQPPLVITAEQADQVCDVLAKALGEVAKSV